MVDESSDALRDGLAGAEAAGLTGLEIPQAFTVLPVPVAILKRDDGSFVAVNEACERLLGVPKSELLGRHARQLEVGLSPEAQRALDVALAQQPHLRGWEGRMRSRGGDWRDVSMSLEPIELFGTRCLLNIMVDVTERKRAEQALREQDRRLAGIVDTALDAIISIDPAGSIVLFNRAAARMFRIEQRDALGSPIDRFIPAPLREAHAAHVTRFAAEGMGSRRMGKSFEVTGLRADGEEFPMEASISLTGEGSAQVLTVMARDVTQLRQAENAQLARRAAEAANRAKTEFLSRISHELRTPLNAVLGFTQLVRDELPDASERQRSQLDLVLQAGGHLRTLIDELLDVSRIEAGGMAMEVVDFDLQEQLDVALRMSEPQAREFGVSLRPMYAAIGSQRIRTDPARLRQVMLNLLSNAIKYSRPGGWVELGLERDHQRLHIVVRDNGMGMDPGQQARLFEPFNRLGREASTVPGSGIGLVLVRQLVALMGGELDIASHAGEGTTVRVTLPIGGSGPPPGEGLPPHDRSDARPAAPSGCVLYIEDNPVNAMLVEQLVAGWPEVQLVIACDGAAGLAEARALRPAVVLLDMQLPDMHGLEVLRQLKADPATSGIAVVALSATAMAADVQAAREGGAVDYWTKPIDVDAFAEGMRRLLQAGGGPGSD